MCIVCASRRYIRGTFLQAKNKRHFFTIGLDFFGRTAIIIHVAIARLCKGSTTDSDSVCLGSNPSRAAKKKKLHGDFTMEFFFLAILYIMSFFILIVNKNCLFYLIMLYLD